MPYQDVMEAGKLGEGVVQRQDYTARIPKDCVDALALQ
jgi:hypothetical protein